MDSTAKSHEPSAKLGRYAYAGSLYFVSVGVLYLWGYWATFGINVLEFASLADILKTSAYPIASTFGLFAIGAVLGEFMVDRSEQSERSIEGRFWTYVRRNLSWISILYFVAVAIVFFFGTDSKWLVLPALVSPPLYIAAKRQGLFEQELSNERTRSIFIFLLVTLPLFSYGQGKLKAMDVISGRNYSYLISSVEGIPASAQTLEKSLRFLGQVQNYLFVYNPADGSTAIVRFEQIKAIQLLRHVNADASKSHQLKPTGASNGASGPAVSASSSSAPSSKSSSAP